MPKPLKILLLGDYSNCHRTLASGLRRLGCEVTLISDGDTWHNCQRDIDISRRPGKLGGLELYLKLSTTLRKHLKGYDIVSVNDANFVGLRPKLIKKVFNRLKRDNGAVFLNAMSHDVPFLDMLASADSPLKYSEWFIDGKPNRLFLEKQSDWEEWHNDALRDYQKFFYDNIDGAASVLYEYHLSLQRLLPANKIAYGGIPVDLDMFTPVQLPEKIDKVKLFLGRDRTRMTMKGSDYLEEAARTIVERYPDKAELMIVENRPFDEFIGLLKNAHVVLDQIYSYTPATTALMAMAYGLNVVSGGEDDYYDFIGEHENQPIINAPVTVEGLTDTLEQIVVHPELIADRGRKSREFVERHNDCKTVAQRYLDFWSSVGN
ncbi:MAG: glycosyltransferase family 1 protein [Muribaculaceae bacterium]|nr:glycosyltransferase family 1 protein [Muribaculaceae bacterium]